MKQETVNMLIEKALAAREASYSPYSSFAVGAALLAESGECFTGANIENSSFSPTVCAERVAFFDAVHSGARKFCAIAIVGGKAGEPIDEYCAPCGVCRQVMSEFCDGDFRVILFNGHEHRIYTLDELLPLRFKL